jgi:hypothetical protein
MLFPNKKSENRFFQYRIAIFSFLMILSIFAACSQNTNAYENGVYWLSKDVDDSTYPYEPINPTTIFYNTDEYVCFLFNIEYVTTSHNIIIKWYNDEDKLFDTMNDQIPHPNTEGYEYYTSYDYYECLHIKGEDAADLPGQWKVELYIDGSKQVTEFFEIRSTTTTATTTTPTTTTTTTTTTTPTTTPSPTQSPTPTPIIPEQEMTITTTPTSTTHQKEEKQVEQSSFLSNPILIMLIVLSIIIVIVLIVMSKRKKPMPSQTQQIPNRYCINCGVVAPPGETFCGSCGKRVE